MMKHKVTKAVILALPILLALIGGALLLYELDARKIPPLIMEPSPPVSETETAAAASPTAPFMKAEAEEQEPLEPEAEPAKKSSISVEALAPNTIHIRGKSYPLMPNIEEATLKNHIGWMNTSAKPGEIGVCVVMGHRNKQLRCLKDVKKGDVITIVDAGGIAHAYTVESGQIVKDKNITFAATYKRVLVLITCYPFYYSGSAPYQYAVTAIGEGDAYAGT